MTDLIVMDNGEDGNTWTPLFIDQIDHKGRLVASRDPASAWSVHLTPA
jgi:hypothetical protein